MNRGRKFLFICGTIQIDSLAFDLEVATIGGCYYLIGGVQFLDRIKVSFFCLLVQNCFIYIDVQ